MNDRIAEAFGVRGARLDPGSRGRAALTALALIVVVAAALIAWMSAPRAEPVAAPIPDMAASRPKYPADRATGSVVVSVAGRVRKPGLVTLQPGARVADAIEAAGGLLPGAKVGYLNLARKVTDGEMILVGVTPPPDAGAGPAAPGGDLAAKISLNTASVTQLETLPGVGPVLAGNIVSYRTDHGGFRSVGDLRQVTGIGPARYEQLKDLVTV
ncbi:MAG: helix-hairpin-helix domain-containing protein [Micromonosporaceae bacterium]